MRFEILGPLRCYGHGDAEVRLGGVRQRAFLAFLLLRPDQVVATSTLMDALWPDGQPDTARKMLQNTASALRATFREDGGSDSAHLLTHTPGYLLRVNAGDIDLFRFRELAHAGAEALALGRPDLAAPALRRALDLWRGPVLSDLVEKGFSWSAIRAIEQSRIDAFEDYFEAELANGRHHRVVSELEALAVTAPRRERLCHQLMLALYRCGRQVDALSAYRRTRNVLADKLGIEPGQSLRELEQAILRHDPSLHTRRERPMVRSVELAGPSALSSRYRRRQARRTGR